MKKLKLVTLILMLILPAPIFAQKNKEKVKIARDNFTVHNRQAKYNNSEVHLNAKKSDGLLWLSDSNFKNGIIEIDIKGKNTPGQSFVGLAFHGQNNATFDAIYFRPFNFKNPARKTHAIQYISMPKNDWSRLRKAFPGKYENTITPLPDDVEAWFHAKIVINHPNVKVYIDGANEPTLEIEQISNAKQGMLGFWVGNGSEGWFKNLTISPAN